MYFIIIFLILSVRDEYFFLSGNEKASTEDCLVFKSISLHSAARCNAGFVFCFYQNRFMCFYKLSTYDYVLNYGNMRYIQSPPKVLEYQGHVICF